MLNIAIVDDNEVTCVEIQNIVNQYFIDKTYDYRTYTFFEAENFLKKLNDESYNIILLDIDMPDMNGLQIAKVLRDHNINSIIIFITHEITYMEKAFGLNVFGFVHKNKMNQYLSEVLGKCVDEIISHVILNFKTNDGLITISKDDIIYVTMESRKVKIHTINNHYLVNLSTLSEFYSRVEQLDHFIYINRSMIINLSYVMSITKTHDVILKGINQKFPISRDKYMEVSKALMNWISKRSIV